MRRAHKARAVSGAILLGLVLLGCGADVARAQVAEQPPARVAEDPEISRWHVEALKTGDPEEKLRIYDKILARDPANTDARLGYKEAKVAVDDKRKADAEKAKTGEKQRNEQVRGRTS